MRHQWRKGGDSLVFFFVAVVEHLSKHRRITKGRFDLWPGCIKKLLKVYSVSRDLTLLLKCDFDSFNLQIQIFYVWKCIKENRRCPLMKQVMRIYQFKNEKNSLIEADMTFLETLFDSICNLNCNMLTKLMIYEADLEEFSQETIRFPSEKRVSSHERGSTWTSWWCASSKACWMLGHQGIDSTPFATKV